MSGATAPAGSPVRRFARREWGPLYARVREALVARTWRAVPMTLVAVCLTLLFQIVQNQEWGYRTVQNIGAVRAQDPLPLALLRTPLSLFVPAPDLPVWGALAQMLLVFGVAEICLGRLRTLFLAYVATLSGTLYARVGVALGPETAIGLPEADRAVVDTGPSAAVVGLALYVCGRYGAHWTAGLVVLAMVVEVIVKPNLAGKEHIAALLGVFLLMLAERAVRGLRERRPAGRGRAVPRSDGPVQGRDEGAPPIQS
ncbi:hypothetical protein [Streptomyces candidus]|uniref:Uncharacterized protein n=1 Tax=Streptomyces candidus TaxID=67283 RepID=A0A7X0HC46_9ACTN|nr:hypothetical protein [Streptomyces candidus]MBB6433819.1 hypothetical protein [Streptomyces candidus]GHH34441.1 hypothetical protein GCM10018773_06570 [Streptomyces candidus]